MLFLRNETKGKTKRKRGKSILTGRAESEEL